MAISEKIKTTFPRCEKNNCLETTNELHFEIYDDSTLKRCFIRRNPSEPVHFVVKNPKRTDINFLAIDKCIFLDSDNFPKCDCAVFDETTFCFIEIKESNFNQRAENKKKGFRQLQSTILKFKEKINFDEYTLEAFLWVGRKETHPSLLAANQSKVVELFNSTGATLYLENEKEFI